jgi:hypothetical protein
MMTERVDVSHLLVTDDEDHQEKDKINTTVNTPITVGGGLIREMESFVYMESGWTSRGVQKRHSKD